MALPIEATPCLNEQEMEELYKMMDEWEANKTPLRHIEVSDEAVQRGIRAIEERRQQRLQASNE